MDPATQRHLHLVGAFHYFDIRGGRMFTREERTHRRESHLAWALLSRDNLTS